MLDDPGTETSLIRCGDRTGGILFQSQQILIMDLKEDYVSPFSKLITPYEYFNKDLLHRIAQACVSCTCIVSVECFCMFVIS